MVAQGGLGCVRRLNLRAEAQPTPHAPSIFRSRAFFHNALTLGPAQEGGFECLTAMFQQLSSCRHFIHQMLARVAMIFDVIESGLPRQSAT
jgi:hypothetical protein